MTNVANFEKVKKTGAFTSVTSPRSVRSTISKTPMPPKLSERKRDEN